MYIIILGCGTSSGVPACVRSGLGSVCDFSETKNMRMRSSVYIMVNGRGILIDTGPDLRFQMLLNKIQRVDAVLYTHAHADHCHGIDELRWVCNVQKKPLKIYGSSETLAELSIRFSYIFDQDHSPMTQGGSYHRPALIPCVVNPGESFTCADIAVQCFEQDHGYSSSLGFRIGDFAYSTDVLKLDEKAFGILEGIRLWVVDANQETEHATHTHLNQTLSWIQRLKPLRAYLTHMNGTMDYGSLCKKLPSFIRPAYDGMVIRHCFYAN